MNDSATSRATILNAIRAARAGVEALAEAPDPYRMPDALLGGIEQFCAFAGEEAATSQRVAGLLEVPAAVLRYLDEQKIDRRIFVAADLKLDRAAWASARPLQIAEGPVGRDGDTLVTGCYAGVAEAGALVMLSSSGEPNEAKFLTATHIAVLSASDIVATFEALWTRLRDEFAETAWPRTMNWIVGPSRTADLGVPSKLGAHGPARVHIIIVDD